MLRLSWRGIFHMHFCFSSRLLVSGGSLSLFFRQRVLRQEEQSYMFDMVLISRTHIPREPAPGSLPYWSQCYENLE